MPIIGAYEAKTRFSELLERAEKGERFTITRHGKVVAEIVPAVSHDVARARAAMQRIRELSKDVDIGDLTWEDIKKLREEGRP
jgi:prevent-host-death family protein